MIQEQSEIRIKPNPGPQTDFSATPVDIAIYGGAAGGGKTWSLLFEPLRHILNPHFGAVIFRRTYPEITNEGSLWDESVRLFGPIGAKPNNSNLLWKFPSGAAISFAHMQHETDRFLYQGAQIPLIEFDELTHFTRDQFFYMLSRNRSTSGIKPYIRASTNPDASSWVRELVDWWIDTESGYPIPERSGKIRYFVNRGGEIFWFASRAEARSFTNGEPSEKSFTFIPASLYDNPVLMGADPGYEINLKNLPAVDRERLLKGNWNIRYQAGAFFKREFFKFVDALPAGERHTIRYWDRAASENKGDFTVGAKLSRDDHGFIYVEDIVRGRWSPRGVEQAILSTASRDGRDALIFLEQEGGSSGVSDVQYLIRALHGYSVYAHKKTGSKADMAKPFAAQVEAGNVYLLRAPWNEAFINECVYFSGDGKGFDDQVDASSGAFSKISEGRGQVVIL